MGGNHAHQRIEGFIASGEGLEFCWLDTKGEVHKKFMNPRGQLQLIVVDAWVPHAIRNNDSHSISVLLEYADLSQEDSAHEYCSVIPDPQAL